MATARCHRKDKADNRGVAEGQDGYVDGTTGLHVGIHFLKKRLYFQNVRGISMAALKPGDKAPDFSLTDQNDKLHQLTEYNGRKLFLFFYPKANTSG